MKIKAGFCDFDAWIRGIEAYEKTLQTKMNKLQEELAKIGIDAATINFKTADYPGENDVVVDPAPKWINDNTLVIEASGASILFIEFGAGVYYASDAHPKADELGYKRGEYGHKLGRLETWRYEGEKGQGGLAWESDKHPGMLETHGNPANRCMYEAGKAMREKVIEVAKEVFRE